MNLSSLTAISPIDGRYASKTECLRSVFSEFALIKYRVYVEVCWLKTLANHPKIKEISTLSNNAKKTLDALVSNFN